MKRKRIEAWVTVDEYGVALCLSHEKLLKFEDGWRDVRLVEHSPAADAVVRAAVKFVEKLKRWSITGLSDERYLPLVKAVERLERERKK